MIDQFSKHLFWDTDKDSLDMNLHAAYIIKYVLNYGFYDDWKLILEFYGMKRSFKLLKPLEI
jgi:hypothetical protein